MSFFDKTYNLIKPFFTDIYDRIFRAAREYNIKKMFRKKERRAVYEKVKLTPSHQKEIDDLFRTCYGKKISNVYHRYYTAFTGRFDPMYFPELLYIPEFEAFMNPRREYCEAFADKNLIPLIASAVGIKTLNTLFSRCSGVYRDAEQNVMSSADFFGALSDAGEVIIKPAVDSNSGRGVILARLQGGRDVISRKAIPQLLSGYGDDFVIQERLVCHESIRRINPGSVNTLRIITYRWDQDGEVKIKHMPLIMRIGRSGSVVDNAHAGGLIIGVGEDGQLAEKAFSASHETFDTHPDTHVRFSETRIEGVDRMIASALRLAGAIPQVGTFNMDFTLDEKGDPVLLETNCKGGSVWLIQQPCGVGGFGSDTPDVLRWLGTIKKLPKSKRKGLYYGRMKEDGR